MRLYEFSSSVIAQYSPELRDYEFIRYEVGQFMNNSFLLDNNIRTNYRGIPEVIDRAIRNDYFTVKTPSYPHLAWTGRYLEDNWVVLVVSDQLAGRPNEVYRYFCVQSPLTETVDPMLSLLNWYLAQPSPPGFEPEPNRNVSVIEIPESLPLDVNQLSERERAVLDKLQEGESRNYTQINLRLEEIVNIIARLSPAERITFSWAIGAYNFNSLVRSGNFRLVQSSNGNLWIGSPTVATTTNMRPRTVDRQTAKSVLTKLALTPRESSSDDFDFNQRLTDLFKQEVDQENWKIIFDNNISLKSRLNTSRPDLADINLLVLQAILIPERIEEIFNFLAKKPERGYEKNFKKAQKALFKFEQRLRESLIYLLRSSSVGRDFFPRNPNGREYSTQEKRERFWVFSQLIEQVYQGVWFCLEDVLEFENNSNGNVQEIDDKHQRRISIVKGFLQHESNWLKRNLSSRHKRTDQGLWEFALISKVRFDFYNHIHSIGRKARGAVNIDNPTSIYPPSEPANSFFQKFESRQNKESLSLNFLKRLWHNDSVITTWLYQQTGEEIPHNTYKTIEHLEYSYPKEPQSETVEDQSETVLLKQFFFPQSNLQPASKWEPILKKLGFGA